jgi:hypothetical protein
MIQGMILIGLQWRRTWSTVKAGGNRLFAYTIEEQSTISMSKQLVPYMPFWYELCPCFSFRNKKPFTAGVGHTNDAQTIG